MNWWGSVNWWGIGFVACLLFIPLALAVAAVLCRDDDVPPRLPVEQAKTWRIIDKVEQPYDWQATDCFTPNLCQWGTDATGVVSCHTCRKVD